MLGVGQIGVVVAAFNIRCAFAVFFVIQNVVTQVSAALCLLVAWTFFVFGPLVTVYSATFFFRVARTLARIFSPGLTVTAVFI